jgi:F-type H+-transporting ATPase subunit delta
MQSPNSTNLTSAEAIIDVGKEQLARTYAKAFLAATESLDQAGLVEELDSLVADVLDKFPDFNFHLTSDFLSHDERVELIDVVLGGRASAPVVNLLKVLSQNHRLGMLMLLVRTIHKLYGEMNGRHEVRVYVPEVLSADLQQGLRQALQTRLGVEADFHFHIKPELIGGMVVQVGDTVFDGSVRTTLERARQQMVMRAIDAIESRPDKFIIEE